MEVTGLVLAAGAGRRYGMPKALVEWHGRLLVERAADTLAAGGCDSVLVVLGAAADEVRTAVLRTATGKARAPGTAAGEVRAAVPGTAAGEVPGLVRTVENPDWATGLASSLRAGLAVLAGTPAAAAVVLPVDMPGVTPAAVRRIVATADPGALAVAGYHDRRGHPVLLGRDHWPGVAASATGDRGARDYVRAHASIVRVVPVGDVADDADLDVPTGAQRA